MSKSFETDWEEVHKNQEWGRYPSEDVVRFIARNYYNKERENVKILDFGCGAGANTWFLSKEGFDTYAFDGSKFAVEKAKAYLSKENLKADFQVADALEINYKKNYFDCIIDSAAICANTIENIVKMYEEIYEMLVDGGKLFTTGIFTTNTTGYGSGIKIEENTYKNISEGALCRKGVLHFFLKDEISEILAKIGFKNISIDMLRRTDRGYTIEYWIVSAEK